MVTAFAVRQEEISPTLGTAGEFIVLTGQRMERIPCPENIPLFLRKYGIRVLICNGIGNCMMDLLSALQIKVIPGVSGKIEEIIPLFRNGSLRSGEKYSCTDHGRSCGSCPGRF